MFKVTEITNIKELDSIVEPWRSLLDQTASKNVFLTPEWVRIWLKHFWPDKPLRFLLVGKDGEPAALAPFLYDPHKREISFPVNGYAHRPDLILGPEKREVLKAIFSHLMHDHPGLRFYLHQIDPTSDMLKLIPTLSSELKLTPIIKESHRMPYLEIDGDWQSYLQSRPKHFRREQKRKLNKIKKSGSVVFKIIEEFMECEAAYPDVLRIEKNSWKEEAGTSFTADPRLDPFYKEICDVFSRKGNMRIYMLYFNDVPIAHIFGIVYRNVYFALKTSYDNNYRHLSPGVVLFNLALADAFNVKFREFDFLGVESRWKSELTPHVREHADMYIYRRTPVSVARKMYEYNFKPFVRKNLPFLLTLKRKVLGAPNNRDN